jgi:hypothetical protein
MTVLSFFVRVSSWSLRPGTISSRVSSFLRIHRNDTYASLDSPAGGLKKPTGLLPDLHVASKEMSNKRKQLVALFFETNLVACPSSYLNVITVRNDPVISPPYL